jgi:hypothetical protein
VEVRTVTKSTSWNELSKLSANYIKGMLNPLEYIDGTVKILENYRNDPNQKIFADTLATAINEAI